MSFSQPPDVSVVFSAKSPEEDAPQPRKRGAGSPSHTKTVSLAGSFDAKIFYSPENSVSGNVQALQRALQSASSREPVRCIGILMNDSKGGKFTVSPSFEQLNCSVAFFHLTGEWSLAAIRSLLPRDFLAPNFNLEVKSSYLASLTRQANGKDSFLKFDSKSGAHGLLFDSKTSPSLQLNSDTVFRGGIILILPFISDEVDIPIAVEDA